MTKASDVTEDAPLPATSPNDMPDHYIESQTSLVDRPLRTLKYAEAFAVLDSYGDIGIVADSAEGLFLRDTRYLSLFEVGIEGRRPLLLGSTLEDDNASLTVALTNPDIRHDGIVIPRDILSIDRNKLLVQGGCYERIAFCNFDSKPCNVRITIRFDADFRDLFEVRGTRRKAHGTKSVEVASESRVVLRYDGLDKISRFTSVNFGPVPAQLDEGAAEYHLTLQPGGKTSIFVSVVCAEGAPAEPMTFMRAYRLNRRGQKQLTAGIATVESSNDLFNEVACRSTADVYMLVSRTKYGLYPFAGIPWFSTVFGRDGIITAMMMLWVDPLIAKGVLRYLAATQATDYDPEADAQPGKILHEQRHGEMANLFEVPFKHYYGTIDATPLFVMLAGMYFERTGDLATIRDIWPNVEAALKWCDECGDRDGDGFVEYIREKDTGLANQGWKDSQDSIFHADGSDAIGPIALCEVQGYVYAAKELAAVIAKGLGHAERAKVLASQAAALKTHFHAAFWCEDIGTYALALDGTKQPCRVRSSNAGHTLFTGIADEAHAQRVASALMNPKAFSGWGIRTIPRGEKRYNPMSYHNGSIWPHDNALIVLGFGRYGLKWEAAQVFAGMFDAASYQELRRLPELFCGFDRKSRRGPIAYPVACAPQAWASAAPFAMLSACLGLRLDHERNEISFIDPRMPAFLDELTIRGLRLGQSVADIRLRRDGEDTTVSVLSRKGDARIVQSR